MDDEKQQDKASDDLTGMKAARTMQVIGQDEVDALNEIFIYDGSMKNKQAWGFFNNQVFQNEPLVFDDEFYGEHWKTLLIKNMSQATADLNKI